MKHSVKVGFSFGLTSAVITTLGLMVSLYFGTNSQFVVIGGILTIAIADTLSDALAIHISEESENKHTTKEIWQSTGSTLLSKFTFAIIFIIPVLLINLSLAIIVNLIIGMFLLSVYSFTLARKQNKKPWKVLTEHLGIACLVIIVTYYIGIWISLVFG